MFGPRKGLTGNFKGHSFNGGICNKVVAAEKAGGLIKVLSYYGAYPKGSPEYDEALAKENAENGADEVSQDSNGGSADEVRAGVQSEGGEPSEVPADDGAAAVDPTAEGGDAAPAGDGHSDAGVPDFAEPDSWPQPSEPSSVGSEAVAAAVMKLDPDVDEHWVQTGAHKGKPKLSAVEDAYGKAGLTRQDLESAIPDWSRDKAVEAALEG
jgi:hypothetical protein